MSESSNNGMQTLDIDPYLNKMERLSICCCLGPWVACTQHPAGLQRGGLQFFTLGAFAQKVAEHAFMVNDDDIRELHRAHYSDDQIFEAAVSAALGAGLYRLQCVLTLLRSK